MKIQWKDLKAAESGWKLNSFQRTEILENCLQGRKARRFSWRWVALPAAYLGTVAAVCLVGFLLWPYIARPQEIPSVIIDGPNAGDRKAHV